MDKTTEKLITFQWEGQNRAGQPANGIIEAKNLAIAKATVRMQGITIKKIGAKRQSLFNRKNKKIKPGDITVFSRQMATMIQAGIPLIQSFNIVINGQTNQRMKELLTTIKKEVEAGSNLSDALKQHPLFFNDLFCNLVSAGEKSGSLDTMLDKVATYKEKIESIKKKIKKALTYPMAVLAIAFIVTAGLLIFVVPQFESLFLGFKADLPALTRSVINLSKLFEKYWYLIFGIIGGAIYAFIRAKKKSEKFAHTIDRLMLKFPVIGSILVQASIARFTRTLSITFAAGLPLIDALQAVAGATGNIIYANATKIIAEEISTGTQLHLAMDNTKLFPNMVIQMIAIGEESGKLEQMLSKVADVYEENVDTAVDALSSLIEPIIMSILGVLVGGLVVAMYLPIFKLGSVV